MLEIGIGVAFLASFLSFDHERNLLGGECFNSVEPGEAIGRRKLLVQEIVFAGRYVLWAAVVVRFLKVVDHFGERIFRDELGFQFH